MIEYEERIKFLIEEYKELYFKDKKETDICFALRVFQEGNFHLGRRCGYEKMIIDLENILGIYDFKESIEREYHKLMYGDE